ncbi:MAG TPA: SDR family NAD(P)-dependent oxidoreductase [Rhodocyclaceae bacterium]
MNAILERLGLADRFRDKVVLVTGGARGVGETAVRQLASLGAKVVLADISERGRQVAGDAVTAGGDACFIRTDMSSLPGIDALVERAVARYGRVDALLAAATRLTAQSIANFSAAAWDDSFFVNVRGPVYLMSRLLPGMLERRSGAMLAMVSGEGIPFVGGYSAQKVALRSAAISLARELPPGCGVSCVAMVPGSVDTPLVHEAIAGIAAESGTPIEAVRDAVRNNPGYDGFVPVEHSAAACLYFLAHAAEFHGQHVDGYLPLHQHGIIDVGEQAAGFLPYRHYEGMPNPKREMGIFVSANLEIEKRVRDRTSRLEEEKDMLHRKSLTDILTGLPNRLLFEDRLRQGLAEARRNRARMALMFIDLDGFKQVNDSHGHHVGDQLLKVAAQRMQERLRQNDTVARLGGDEFVVLLSAVDGEDQVRGVAEKIRGALGEPFRLAGVELSISSSIGVGIYPEHGDDERTLLARADAAMYAAKSGGRNRVHIPDGAE